MSEPLSEQERYELGVKLGKAIWSIFESIAKLDNVTTQESVDSWVSSYVAERIMHPD